MTKDKNFGKTWIGSLAPKKLELAALLGKTAGKEAYFPTHVLSYCQDILAKLDKAYTTLQPILEGTQPLADVAADSAAYDTQLKNFTAEGTGAVERLKVQVREVEKWGEN